MSLILVRQEYGGRERPYVMRTNTSGGGHLLHYFCTIIVLLGFSVTFAALAGMRANLASQDTRTPLVREYNRAVDAWVKTGREAFTTRTDGFAWAVDKAPFGALARRNGTCGDGRTVPGSLAAPEPGQVALGTEDDGIDIARYELTSVLYGVKRAYIAAHDAANAPGLEQVSVEIGRGRAKSNDVDSYTAFSTSFAPYECDVLSVPRAASSGHAGGGGDARNTRNGGTWSPGHGAHGTTEVRCDECSRDDEAGAVTAVTAGCDARCLPGAADRDIVATRRWVRRVVLVRSQVEDGKVAGIMRKPSAATCSLFHGETRTTTHESVWDARLACAHDRAPLTDVDLELEVRARDDPHVLAGELTGCTFHFGRDADENAVAAAFFTLGAFVTLGLATYCVKKRKGFERYDSRLTQFSGWNAWRTPVTAMDFVSRDSRSRRGRANESAENAGEQSCDDETDHEGAEDVDVDVDVDVHVDVEADGDGADAASREAAADERV